MWVYLRQHHARWAGSDNTYLTPSGLWRRVVGLSYCRGRHGDVNYADPSFTKAPGQVDVLDALGSACDGLVYLMFSL